MKIKHLALMAAAVAAFATGAAQAGTVTLSNILAQWYDGNPAANVTDFNNLTTTPQARWGTGGPQSGYDFTVAAQPINFIVPPSPSPNVVIGTFTHLNNPITSGTSITDIKLRVTADVAIDAINQGNLEFNTNFSHWETPNAAIPCADGGTSGVGVNLNGCADRVIASYLPISENFLIGGDLYTLKVNGFSLTPDGLLPFTSFWTTETADNSAYLVASVELSNGNIPEPGTLALLGLGLIGLVTARRVKQARQV